MVAKGAMFPGARMVKSNLNKQNIISLSGPSSSLTTTAPPLSSAVVVVSVRGGVGEQMSGQQGMTTCFILISIARIGKATRQRSAALCFHDGGGWPRQGGMMAMAFLLLCKTSRTHTLSDQRKSTLLMPAVHEAARIDYLLRK